MSFRGGRPPLVSGWKTWPPPQERAPTGLYVDASGNVLRRTTAGARESAETSVDANWTLTADNHLLNANTGGVMVGAGMAATPAGYKLYVSDGILTERVKVAVKSTADWRDYVLGNDHELRSIEEVESYIQEKRRLPRRAERPGNGAEWQ